MGSSQSTGGAQVVRLRIPADPRYARVVRDRLVRFTEGRPIERQDVEEFVTAVSEAFANAIEHSGSHDPVDLELRLHDSDMVVATVADHGRGFAAERLPGELPPAAALRGRGIPLMRRYSDVFSLQSDPRSGTRVTLGRYLRRIA